MTRYLTELGDVLRDAGLDVVEVPGARTRGHGAMDDQPAGVLCHHTAGPKTGGGQWPRTAPRLFVPGYPSLGVVVDGRPGLEGPLCNLGLTRAGVWVFVAAGVAWHAGTGSAAWCTTRGNYRLIGVEAESTGVTDDWTDEQRESYPRGVAALIAHYGLSPARAIGHKEWAPGRKIDPAFVDMGQFRRAVTAWRDQPGRAPAAPANPTPAAAPALITEDKQMDIELAVKPDGTFGRMVKVEVGGVVAQRVFATFGAYLGSVHYVLTAWSADGKPYRPDPVWDGFELAEGKHYGVEVPAGSRALVIEGRVEQGAHPVAAVWHLT